MYICSIYMHILIYIYAIASRVGDGDWNFRIF